MTRQVYQRTVHVWAIPHVITVYQKSRIGAILKSRLIVPCRVYRVLRCL